MKPLVFLLLSLFAWGAQARPAGDRPNFVVIFCDDLGYGDLGCFGNPVIRTPHLDRLAVEGQKWTSFYVGASVCTPSRAALLTGRLPIRNGMMSARRRVLFPDSKGGLPASEITLAELLKTKGYATAAIGKWHLGHLPEFLPTRHGFDTYWGIPYSNDMDHRKGFPNYSAMARKDPYYQPPIEQYHVPIIEGDAEIERPADQRTITRRYTDQTVAFIHEHREQPFFIYLAHSLPHIPLFAGEDFRGNSRRGIYGDVIEEIDAQVGRVVAALEANNLSENTVLVFTSDNGPWLPFQTHGGVAGPLREGKGTTFEGGMRVPTIWWGPGQVTPGVVAEPGTTMDVLPTFCALAGVDVPDDRVLDGVDLRPLLDQPQGQGPRQEVYFWRQEKLYAVRKGPWKLHFLLQGAYRKGSSLQTPETPELYHLDTDPGEQYNVAQHHPDVVEELKKLAETHQAGVEPMENQLLKR